jgi:hypothetical protein
MDYNQLREGITVYLPVYVPGALLFVGDGHATQGAGELTGNALETSMDIEFTVDVQAGGAPPSPRFENTEYLMASGIAGSVDNAFRGATTNLVRWLQQMFSLKRRRSVICPWNRHGVRHCRGRRSSAPRGGQSRQIASHPASTDQLTEKRELTGCRRRQSPKPAQRCC